VRHGRVVVLAAVVLTGVTGCANRPNNLETYYNKPADSSGMPASTSSVSPSLPPASEDAVDQAAAGSAESSIADEVATAVLTKGDLAGEGVRAAGARADNGACFNAVPSGDPRGATWLYPSGSSLTQQVTGYLDRSATDVLAQVQCGGQRLTVPLPSGADAVRGWCEGTTCTVLLAAGHVLSGLQISASTATRASDAVRGLAPLAAKKLPSA
jgi:hypothetical protein